MNESTLTGLKGAMIIVAGGFINDSIARCVPWIIVMFAVIVCDLVLALRRCFLTGEHVRISRAVRQTMGKMVSYTSFVFMVCVLEVACGATMHIDRWACLIVCAVEFVSIVSNILRPKGYDIDFTRLLAAVFKRLFGTAGGEVEGVIRKTGEKPKGTFDDA